MPEDRPRAGTDLDRALDAALADVTSSPPRDDLRARVLARLSTGEVSRRPSASFVRWSMALPAAAAVLALMLAGAWLTRRTDAPGPREAGPAAVVPPAAVGSPPVAERDAEPNVSPVPPVAPHVARATRPRAPARSVPAPVAVTGWAPSPYDEASTVPPLQPAAPLHVSELAVVEAEEPSPIAVPLLHIEPLADAEDSEVARP